MARTLTDAEGREYPASILDPAIVKRDRIVQKVMKRAQRLHTSITNEKERMSTEIEKYLDDLAAQYDETWKGNAELVSFDGLFKVEVRNRERITFGVELQLAKQKIGLRLKIIILTCTRTCFLWVKLVSWERLHQRGVKGL